ncbi:MAG: 30S ribosomal protein S21 [Candidatus Aureabacteria bacterium]|nr:30S ribosomal protein S21 [Candidatus Auribacterota bacterium]
MPKVILRPNEPVERALRRLKKKIDKEGIMKQVRRHRHYEKPSQKRRRKAQEARRR